MKHELPIAIVLLAIACMPWIWRHGEPLSASQPTQHLEDQELIATEPLDGFTPAATQPMPQATEDQSREFLRDVSRALENGRPSIGRFEVENYLFDSSLQGSGKFWCSGNGLNRSRFELIPDSEDAMITQVCDGRFVYRLIENSGNRQLNFYDLEKLQSDDLPNGGLIPSNWHGFNSISGLLFSLANTFRFEPMKSSADGRQIEIVGTWDLHHLATLMVDHVDHRSILTDPDWSKIPAQIPHGVRLRFEDVRGEWQARELLFFKIDSTTPSKQPSKALLVRLGKLQHQSIRDDLFQLDTSDADAQDETESYRHRMNALKGTQRVAENAAEQSR